MPPSKTQQVAEAEARKAAGVDPVETASALDVVDDGPRGDDGNGAPRLTGDGDGSQQRRPPAPTKSAFDNRRDAIVARFRQDRTAEANEQREDVSEFTHSGMPPEFETFREHPTDEGAQQNEDHGEEQQQQDEQEEAAAAPALPARVKIKVYGEEREVPLEEALAKAQIAYASEDVLDKAKSRLREVDDLLKDTRNRAARPGPAGHQAGEQRTQAADAAAPSADEEEAAQTSDDPITRLIETLQYGDPSDARPLFEQTIQQVATKVVGQTSQANRLKDEGARSAKVLKDFKEKHPELANDAFAQSVMQTRVYQLQVEDLKAIGVEPEMIQTPDGIVRPADIAQAHAYYRSEGFELRTPQTMLETARDDFLRWKGNGTATQPADPAQRGQPRVIVDRGARRQAIPQTPTHTAPPRPAAPAPAQRRDGSEVVRQMNARRLLPRGRVGVG